MLLLPHFLLKSISLGNRYRMDATDNITEQSTAQALTCTAQMSQGQKRRRRRKRPGGQPANTNAIRHGLRASRLPKGCAWIDSQVEALRRDLLEAVQQRGPVTLFQSAVIQSLCRHEQRVLLSYRWLRQGGDEMSVRDKSALLDAVSRATVLRDACLRELGIHEEPDVFAAYYSPAQPGAPAASPVGDPPQGDSTAELAENSQPEAAGGAQ
jgi:hypothetical protein